jgi:hypothetical protein
MVLCIILFLGMAGLTIDIGHAFVSYQELQTSTDAAALAAGYAMASSSATVSSIQDAAAGYSSATSKTISGVNVDSSMLPGVVITTNPVCFTSISSQLPCGSTAAGNYNGVRVVQTMTAPTYFMRAMNAFGIRTAGSIPLTTTAVAAMRGSVNAQYNVAIVLDTTQSMTNPDTDASCNDDRIACAETGLQTLLQSLTPCGKGSTSSKCVSGFDQVSLFTFPAVTANTAADDTTCTTTNPTIVNYPTPVAGATTWTAPTGAAATYQLTSYLNDYSSTNAAGGALAITSALSIAAGANTTKNCSGIVAKGGKGTYFAGAIYAALDSLAAKQSATVGSLNALIILSDGDASTSSSDITATNGLTVNTTGTYPSAKDQCQQAVTAAKSAPSNTTVYSIAYGAASSGCSTDTTGSLKGISPCTTMRDMATAPADFYSDATASQNKGQCTSASNPSLTLNQIFKSVATSFTVARLLPTNAT